MRKIVYRGEAVAEAAAEEQKLPRRTRAHPKVRKSNIPATDPLRICENLEEVLPAAGQFLKTRTEALIAALQNLALGNGGIDGINKIAGEILTARYRGGIEKTARRIRELVLAVLEIQIPKEDPFFELWIAENTNPDSIGREVAAVMGEKPTGRRTSPLETANDIRGKTGRKIFSDSVSKVFPYLEKQTEGTRYEMGIDRTDPLKYLYFMNRNPECNDYEDMDPSLISIKKWAADLCKIERESYAKMHLRTITDNPIDTEFSKEYLARKLFERYGIVVDLADRKDVSNKILTPLSETILRAEKKGGGYSLRRVRRGGGKTVEVAFKLVDREKSQEKWINERTRKESLMREIARGMFEFKLGRKFNQYYLSELLSENEKRIAPHRIVRTIKEWNTPEKAEGADYEIIGRENRTKNGRKIFECWIRP